MYQFASAAYAATARLALNGTALQADVLFASARRIQDVIERWPSSEPDLEGVLDHATRAWSLILGESLDDDGMPEKGQQAAARLARTVFDALEDAVTAPSVDSLANLSHVTCRYALALRQTSEPVGWEKPTLLQRLRAKSSPSGAGQALSPPRFESPWREGHART